MTSSAATMPFTRGEIRRWALENLRGVCNVVIASYSSDLTALNEDAIRHDIRRNIELGFIGTLLVGETALTVDEYLKFVEIAAGESAGRQILIHHACFNTLDENIAVARQAARLGARLALLSYPPGFYPQSESEVYEYTSAFCRAVDLGVILFPVPLWGFERFSPASLSMDLIERLLDEHPTICVIKAEGGMPSIAGFTNAWYRFSDRVIVTMPLEQDAIPLATVVPMQLIATSNTEYYGTAVPRALQLAHEEKFDEAMDVYWRLSPAREANAGAVTGSGFNMVHRMVWKYQAWLNGYNGGPLRAPIPRISGRQMAALRRGLQLSGVPLAEDPDGAFFVGRNPV